MSTTILIIDDDTKLNQLLVDFFRSSGSGPLLRSGPKMG